MPSKKLAVKRIVSVTPIMTGSNQENTTFLVVCQATDDTLWYTYKKPTDTRMRWMPFALPEFP